MAICPRCGGYRFRYELRAAGTRSKTYFYRTGVKKSWLFPTGRRSYNSRRLQRSVGFCPDCGYTADSFTIGITYLIKLLFLPVTISIWFFKTERLRLSKPWRVLIIIAFWILMGVMANYTKQGQLSEIANTSSMR